MLSVVYFTFTVNANGVLFNSLKHSQDRQNITYMSHDIGNLQTYHSEH